MPKLLLHLSVFLLFLPGVLLGQIVDIQSDDESIRVVHLDFQAEINNQTLQLGKKYFIEQIGDSVSIDRLKFYISGLTFLNAKGVPIDSMQRFYLIDFEEKLSLKRNVITPKNAVLKDLQFFIGIDSLTQVGGARGGELDPTQGMYWTWQSGYINFKLEGKSSICPARNNVFQYHIGGYQFPFNSLQTVKLPLHNADSVIVKIDLNKILTIENISVNYQIMSPSEKSMEFAVELPNLFSVAY